MRVAASVILPDLAQRLADARKQSRDYQAYLDRLNGARHAGDVDDRAFTILAGEYRKDAASSRVLLDALQAEADVWRRDGRALLDACADWATVESRVLAARRLVEQQEAASDHHVLLQREQARLDEARNALASL